MAGKVESKAMIYALLYRFILSNRNPHATIASSDNLLKLGIALEEESGSRSRSRYEEAI